MSTQSNARSRGFTIIELIVVIVVLFGISALFYYQKDALQSAKLDEQRKTAVNAIYYNLEEVYYPKNGYYPKELSTKVLPAVDPELLTDTNGVKIDENLDTSSLDAETAASLTDADKKLSEYYYTPTDCDNDGHCKSYTLTVTLSNEADYTKKSRHS